MEEIHFDMDAIEKTFTKYSKGQTFDGVVVLKRADGVIFNIGGKNDAFIPKNDFDDFNEIKIGERFKVVITSTKNDEGLIEASKKLAEEIIIGNQNAEKLRLGSKFSFVVTDVKNGFISKMGDYRIFIPMSEIDNKFNRAIKGFEGKRFQAIVTEIRNNEKEIIGSIKLLEEQTKIALETNFWNAIFINKIVKGTVKKVMPYGAFIDVDGVTCFIHISDLSYERVENVNNILKEGQEYTFRVIKLDKEEKKVSLGIKQLYDDPKTTAIKSLNAGEEYQGEVIKLLAFGAIVKLENGAEGLLHISNATEDRTKNIYEIVKVGDKIKVEVLEIDEERKRVSLKLR